MIDLGFELARIANSQAVNVYNDVAVIGLADADLGRRVHAIVTLHKDTEAVSEDELLGLCAQHLLRYKVPRSLEFVPELPRTEAGKIRRSALRDARES